MESFKTITPILLRAEARDYLLRQMKMLQLFRVIFIEYFNQLLILEFSGDDLVAQAAVFFTGGFETSSTTMSFTLYELALNPDVQTTLRKEIRDALEETDGKITYDMVRNRYENF